MTAKKSCLKNIEKNYVEGFTNLSVALTIHEPFGKSLPTTDITTSLFKEFSDRIVG